MELPKSLSSLFIAIAILFAHLSSFNTVDAGNGGFSVELIHRDSQNSPFYDPKQTPAQRLANAFRRSIDRINHFYPTNTISPNSPKSILTANNGEYLMKISIGTPPFPILAIADTGSDLIWTQCKPCINCYKQDAPLFDPKSSKTYRDISCNSTQCNYLQQYSCSPSNVCTYHYQYEDLSFTNGNLAVDTVTLDSTSGRPVYFPKQIFGCGLQNGGTFNEKGSGIIGLGGGRLSLIRQLGTSIGGKFSYCLVPYSSRGQNSSTLNFGDNAIVSGKGAVSTPLFIGEQETFYFLSLEAISVGNVKIPYISSTSSGGNILIDSGTTLTLVPLQFFSELSSAVENVVRGRKVKDPNGILPLCYAFNSSLDVPILTVHFKGGADVKLNPNTTYVEVAQGVVCFAFKPSSVAIFGNLAQSNLLVGYDLEAMTVSFKPTVCTTV